MFEHRINTKTKNMGFRWRSLLSQSLLSQSWRELKGSVPEILEKISEVPGLMSDYHWTYCSVVIEEFVAGGITYSGPGEVHRAMTLLTARGGMGKFQTLPTRKQPSTVVRMSFSLTPESAKYLKRFDNQSAEVNRLIELEIEKNACI
ncbi:MAG: hypothetical protein ACRC2U_01060 [Aeromonas sp.]